MKAVITTSGGKTAVQEIPTPKPSPGEILVRVHYVAQNPTDWKGTLHSPPGLIVGCDFAGTIADPNDSSWLPNQRIAGFVHGTRALPRRGAFAEYLVTESSLVWAVPDTLSLRDAATVSLALATAAQALFQRLGLPGPSAPVSGSPVPILINGGAGSVGMYAIQLAKLAGLHVITTGSRQNHELLRSLGADEVVDYADPGWPEYVRERTHDDLRFAFDTVSEPATTNAVARALSVSKGGRIMCTLPRTSKELSGELAHVDVDSTIVYTVFGRAIDLTGTGFGNWGGETPVDRAFWEEYLRLLPGFMQTGGIRANPSRELGGLDAVREGFEMQIGGRVRGEKIVYRIV